MTISAYSRYKESGVDWLGQVPSEWLIAPLKRQAHIEMGQSPAATDINLDGKGIPFLQGCADFEEINPRPSTYCEVPRKSAHPNDILLSVRAPVGALNLADERVGIGRGLCAIRGSNPRFLWHVLSAATAALRSVATGSTYEAVSVSDVANLRVPLLSALEQKDIVAFLDHETAKIDESFKMQSKLILLLKEKERVLITRAVSLGIDQSVTIRSSKVEWLGKIPSHWKLTRIANLFQEINQPSDDTRPILSVSIHHGVSDGELSEAESGRKVTRSEDRSKYKAVEPGDLVYNMMRAWQGGFGAVTVNGAVSPAYVVARPDSPHLAEYIELVLRTPKAIAEMKRHSRGITDFRMRLYWDKFKDIEVPVPPEDEMLEILERVREIKAETARVVDAASRMNGLLQERRAAIISATVTGKIDVRGYNENNKREAA